jgi:hypothetical protein
MSMYPGWFNAYGMVTCIRDQMAGLGVVRGHISFIQPMTTPAYEHQQR